jgi:hypothetical protein
MVARGRHRVDEGVVADGTQQIRVRVADVGERVHVEDGIAAIASRNVQGGQVWFDLRS